MIRREIEFRDCAPAWLLIAQPAHAALSGELARAWNEQFPEEVHAGIAHHDDGWHDWESAPQLDSQGRPLSFTELEITDAIAIWDRSIAAARSFGPLAGAIVAGHFAGLARGSDQADQPRAHDWLLEISRRRAAWLADWRRASPSNTPRLAEHAQQMLLVADLLSLWLCCDGLIPGNDARTQANTEMLDRTSTILGKYRFDTQVQSVDYSQPLDGRSITDGGVSTIHWQGSLHPWPLAPDVVHLSAPAVAVPAAKYSSWRELTDMSRPAQLVWQLRKTLLPPAEC